MLFLWWCFWGHRLASGGSSFGHHHAVVSAATASVSVGPPIPRPRPRQLQRRFWRQERTKRRTVAVASVLLHHHPNDGDVALPFRGTRLDSWNKPTRGPPQQSTGMPSESERCQQNLRQQQQLELAPSNQSHHRRRGVTALLVAAAASAVGVPAMVLSSSTSSALAVMPPASSLDSSAPPLVASNPSSGSGPCASGGLAPELPIPGAYQNACMELNERQIPVVVPAATEILTTDDAAAIVVTANAAEGRNGETSGAAWGGTDNCDNGARVVWLTIEQRPGQVGAGATGKAVWNSGILLSRLLQRIASRTTTTGEGGSSPTNWFTGKTVMELGCGVGLGSLTCALLGPERVYATDGNDSVVPIAARNVEINRLDSIVTTTVLPWGILPAMDYSEQVDLVIGSDLTYSPGSWRALAESMETVLKRDGYVLYVSLGHAGFPVSAEVGGFVTVARDMGLVPVESSYDPLWPFPPLASPTSASSRQSLSDLMMQECLVDARERDIVESAGGVRVVLLARKRNPVFTTRV
jgi:SAM-dependent methyltransferase